MTLPRYVARGRGRPKGKPTVYWTEPERVRLIFALTKLSLDMPGRSKTAIARRMLQYARDEAECVGQYRGADRD